jgi:formylglycine-generating enzyme required for sulfatase activity
MTPEEKPAIRRIDIIPQIIPPVMRLIPEGYVILGTSLEQVAHMLEFEDWAEEWFNRDLFAVEQPQHELLIPAFEIGAYPVTNAEYFVFAWSTGYRVPKHWHGFRHADAIKDHPVVGVSQEDAITYCEWLSKQTGQKYRLPSEAEWERAARGNDARIYPWGDRFENWRCNTLEGGKRGTTPVGSYSPGGDSPFGVADMAGNVWEWTRSKLMPYPYDPNDGREIITKDSHCVLRGGSWYYSRKLARCSTREWVLPTHTSPLVGFRIVRELEEAPPSAPPAATQVQQTQQQPQ